MSEKKISLELKSLMNTMARYTARERCAPPGKFTEMHAEIMVYLLNTKERTIVQKDLEEVFTIRKSTASRMLHLMEHRGLIERVTTSDDARQKHIVPTQRAYEIRERIQLTQAKFETVLRAGISEEELYVFFRVIDQLKENLE